MHFRLYHCFTTGFYLTLLLELPVTRKKTKQNLMQNESTHMQHVDPAEYELVEKCNEFKYSRFIK